VPDTVTLVHMSDTHILPSDEARFLGQNHSQNLRSALAIVRGRGIKADGFVLSGDLANTGDPDSYRGLRAILDDLRQAGVPVLLAMGNHDDRRGLRRIVLDHMEHDVEGEYHHTAWLGGLRVIVLDSTIPESHNGEIGAAQREWLARELAKPAPEGTVLVFHHPPFPPGAALGSEPMLADWRELEDLVRGSDVVGVLCGHVHQSISSGFAGVPLVTAPATAFLVDPFVKPGIAMLAGGGFNVVTVRDRLMLARPVYLPIEQRLLYHHNPPTNPVHPDMMVFAKQDHSGRILRGAYPAAHA
jgi:3',5'-cyclic AMP phosphodiesterase CpdA